MAEFTCGVNQGLGPLPSDPDNNVVLTVDAVLGGILVRWSYPQLNPEAVAHIVVYRSTSAVHSEDNQYATAKGDRFFDDMELADSGTEYWYWIRIISINGTEGVLIGPESAIVIGNDTHILSYLTNKIDNSKLAAALRTDIDDIPSLRADLLAEAATRGTEDTNLSLTMAANGTDINAAFAAIQTEETARISGDDVLAARTTTLEASIGDFEEADVSAQIQANNIVQIGYCNVGGSPDMAANTQALCDAAQGVWVAGEPLAASTLNLQVNDGEESAKLQEQLTTYRNLFGDLDSSYTVKLQQTGEDIHQNRYFGGFGLYGDGATDTVSMGFNVDSFWVGQVDSEPPGNAGPKGGKEGNYPFIIDNNQVYMKNAYIQNAAIDTLRVAGNAITTTSFDTTNTTHVYYYESAATSGTWLHYTDSNDWTVQDLIDNTVTSTGSIPVGAIDTPNIAGETYPIYLTVTFDVGIKCRNGSVIYGANFHLDLYVYFDAVYEAVSGFTAKLVQANTCYHTADVSSYSFTYEINAPANTSVTYFLNDGVLPLKLNTYFGGQDPGADGLVIEYGFIRNITYSAVMLLR